jgi:hypothetical protein
MASGGFEVDASAYVALAKAMRAEGVGKGRNSLLGMMNAEMKAIAEPIQQQMAREVVGLNVKGTKSAGASLARASKETAQKKGESDAAYAKRLARSKDPSKAKPQRGAETAAEYRARIKKRVEKGGGGLRSNVARSLMVKTKDNGYRQQTGVRITTDGSRLPEKMRKLPRGLDSVKGWNHPVFGNRKVWSKQYGTPAGWFFGTAEANRLLAQKRIEKVLEKYRDHLASLLNKAA